MAPGYVVALIVEAAGLFGVLVALLVMRAETRARSADLRGYLRSGSRGSSGPVVSTRRTSVRVVDLPASRRAATPEAARAALHRVFVPRAARFGDTRRLSAG